MKEYVIYGKALRFHQYVKNILVFVPLVTAHKITDPLIVLKTSIAFLSFCLCASGAYLINDYFDLQNDRLHPKKCIRPFASGELPLIKGMFFVPCLVLSSFLLAFYLSKAFFFTIAMYFIMTIMYSLWIKRIAILDVVLLAILYTTRIVGGLTATNLDYSFWLLAFSIFLFVSLAFIKRYSELLLAHDNESTDMLSGRGYVISDMQLISSLGGASGYTAVLVLALYLNSNDVVKLYHNPKILWGICPLMLFWISNLWLATQRGRMHDDPVIFALRDKASLVISILIAIMIIAAT